MGRVVIIGGGVSGAIAALAARRSGATVTLVGDVLAGADRCPGVLDFAHARHGQPGTLSTLDGARAVAKRDGTHAFSVLGARREAAVRSAHDLLVDELDALGLRGPGVASRDVLLLATGSGPRPVALAPESLARGDLRALQLDARVGIVAVQGLEGVDAEAVRAGLLEGGREAMVLPIVVDGFAGGSLAAFAEFVDEGGREAFVSAVLAAADVAECRHAALPTAGWIDPSGVCDELVARGLLMAAEFVAEAPTVAGVRLARALEARLKRAGIDVEAGPFEGVESSGDDVVRVRVGGKVLETEAIVGVDAALPAACGWATTTVTPRDGWAGDQAGHAGAHTDPLLRPMGSNDGLACANAFLAGPALASCDPDHAWTGLGIAAVTAVAAGEGAAQHAVGGSRPQAKLG